MCGQCAHSELQCEGYDQARVFVHNNQKQGVSGTYQFVPTSYSTKRKSRFSGEKPAAPCIPSLPVVLEASLERTAVSARYLEIYWTSFLPHGQGFSPRAAQYSTTSWVGVVQDLCYRSDVVRFALLANALGLVGQQSGQASVIMEGWRMYGKSLHTVANALAAAQGAGTENLLAASGLLAVFEVWPKRLSSFIIIVPSKYQLISGEIQASSSCRWAAHLAGGDYLAQARLRRDGDYLGTAT